MKPPESGAQGGRSGAADPSAGSDADNALWRRARPAPLDPAARQRIAAHLASLGRTRARSWRLAPVAIVLLGVGGVASATVAKLGLFRPAPRPEPAPAREPRGHAPGGRDLRPLRPAALAVPDAGAAAVMSESPPAAVSAPRLPSPAAKMALVSRPAAAPHAPAAVTSSAPAAVTPASLAPAAQAPLVAPPPAVLPPESASPAPPSALARESASLGAALRKLRQDRDPEAALALLIEHRARFPQGLLRREADLARIDALQALGRRAALLVALEELSLESAPRGRELRVLRAELRLGDHQPGLARADFDRVLAEDATDELAARALFGRASCRAQLGDAVGARADLEVYLARHPTGPRAAEVERLLAR